MRKLLEIDKWIIENQGKHFCQCGCGKKVKTLRAYFCRDRYIPSYINGHNLKQFAYSLKRTQKLRALTKNAKCKYCGNIRKVKIYLYKKFDKFFCNQDCCKKFQLQHSNFFQKGEKHPTFRHGLTEKKSYKNFIGNFRRNFNISAKEIPVEILLLNEEMYKTKEVVNEFRTRKKGSNIAIASKSNNGYYSNN